MKRYATFLLVSFILITGTLSAQQLQTERSGSDTFVFLPLVAKSVTPVYKIAFSLSDSTGQDLYIMDSDGANVTPLITGDRSETWPRWSPSGRALAFRQRDTAGDILAVTDIYGSTPIAAINTQNQLGNGVTIDETFGWSADGSQLVLSTMGAVNDIFVVDANGSRVQNVTLTSAETEYDPSWSPISNDLIFASETITNGVPRGAIKWTNTNAMTPTVIYGPLDNHLFYTPTYSPDGTQIAFVDHAAPFSMLAGQLVIMKADGSDVQRFGAPFPLQTGLSWSPDGTQIAFIGENDNGDIRASIVQVADGTWSQSLLPADVRSRVTWTADSRNLIFDAPSGDPTTRNLYRCDFGCAFTSLFTDAAAGEQYLQPVLSPRPLP